MKSCSRTVGPRLVVAALLGCAAVVWGFPGRPPLEEARAEGPPPPPRPTGDFRLRSESKYLHPRGRGRGRDLAAANVAGCGPVVPGTIHRFVDGLDRCVAPMTGAEVAARLNDPFATAVLRAGTFPDSVAAIVKAVGDSRLGFTLSSFLVGEGGQVPDTVAPRDDPRDLRYVLAWGPSPNEGAILLSAAPGGRSSFLQVISWDPSARKYNFYEFRHQVGAAPDDPRVWSWAGESPMARAAATRGRGCFDCHHNGVVIMKELQFPWNNWQSEAATIASLVVPPAVAAEDLFRNLRGAEVLEKVVEGGFQRHHRQWLRDRFKNVGGTVQLTDVNQMLRHLTTNTTVNFASSGIQSDGRQTSPPNRDVSGFPLDTLVWDSALRTLLNLDYNVKEIVFARADFDAYVRQHKFALVQSDFTAKGGGPLFRKEGTTYFAGFVPVPSAEDLFFLTQLRSAGIVTDKFLASVLMVDVRNPVFSAARSSLQRYADQVTSGTIAGGKSSVPDAFAAKVRAAAATQPPCDPAALERCTAEQQFLFFWDLPDDRWKAEASRRIQRSLDEDAALGPADRLDRLMRLAARRGAQFSTWPVLRNLHEFSLLLPASDLDR